MADPTTNLSVIQADEFLVWDKVLKTYVNLQSGAGGLSAATVSTLQTLATAIGSDPSLTNAALGASLSTKAPLASPAFTGTVTGVTKAMVGLTSVDDTADSAKPVSTPVQNALNLKASLVSPAFAGTVTGITKAMVGLASVSDTADSAKPVSTAMQTALDLKANIATTYTMTQVDGLFTTLVGGAPATLNTLNELSTALGADANFAATIATNLSGKQTKFVQSTIPVNAVRLFDVDTVKFRGIQAKPPLSVDTTLGGDAYLSISSDTFSKAEIGAAVTTAALTATTANVNSINTIPDMSNPLVVSYPDLAVGQNLTVGTVAIAEEPQSLQQQQRGDR